MRHARVGHLRGQGTCAVGALARERATGGADPNPDPETEHRWHIRGAAATARGPHARGSQVRVGHPRGRGCG